VVTIGYVACTLITYCCWWHKPQDAEVSITVNCRSLTKADFHQQIEALQETPFVYRWWENASLCVVAGIFGVVHCTAWNFFFSTSAEGVIWRVASFLTAVIPSVLCIIAWEKPLDCLKSISVPLMMVYIPVRLYLMIEPFVAFRSVPLGIFYTVNWSTSIPHI
jgi:hypothetical protein